MDHPWITSAVTWILWLIASSAFPVTEESGQVFFFHMGLLEKVVLFTAVYVPATVFTNVLK